MLLAFCLFCHPRIGYSDTVYVRKPNYSPKPRARRPSARSLSSKNIRFSLLGSQTKIHEELPNVK